MMFFFDPLYLVFALPALLLAFYAQFKVRSAYNKYLRVPNSRGATGLDVARYLLSSAGLEFVNVEGTRSPLGDHYDPRSKTLRLSPPIAQSRSVGAAAIVAHEVGHAVQDAQAYAPLRLRSGLVPVATFGSWLGPILFFLGMLLQVYGAVALGNNLAWIGVGLFAAAAVFAVLTLPVEFNASRRALEMLTAHAVLVGEQERRGAQVVLNAAALTYVAALAQALSTLLYYVFLLGGFGRRRR